MSGEKGKKPAQSDLVNCSVAFVTNPLYDPLRTRVNTTGGKDPHSLYHYSVCVDVTSIIKLVNLFSHLI